MSPPASGHQQLGQLLVQAGALDDLQLRSALGHQRQWGGRLGRILVELKFIDEAVLAATLAKQLNLESVRITGEVVDPQVLRLVPQPIAERYWIFPLKFQPDGRGTGGELTVAVADPTNVAAIEDIRFHTGKRIRVLVAPESDIEAAIRRFYYGDAAVELVQAIPEEIFDKNATFLGEPEEAELAELDPLPAEAPAATGDALQDFFSGMTAAPPSLAPVEPFTSPEPLELVPVPADAALDLGLPGAEGSAFESSPGPFEGGALGEHEALASLPELMASLDLRPTPTLELVPVEPAPDEPSVELVPVAESEPMAAEPMAAEPMAAEPMAEEPMAEEPMAEEPMAEEPMAEEPMAAEPMAAEPMAAELGFERGLPDADGFRAGALNEGELRLLDGLESPSLTSAPEPEVIKPGELVSALVRILIRKGYMAEAELIEELQRR